MTTWTYTIRIADIWKNDALSFEEQRDRIVARLRKSQWFSDSGDQSDLAAYVDELADATSFDEFNGPWGEIYDLADADRAWIAIY
jgi:hypothetical protein